MISALLISILLSGSAHAEDASAICAKAGGIFSAGTLVDGPKVDVCGFGSALVSATSIAKLADPARRDQGIRRYEQALRSFLKIAPPPQDPNAIPPRPLPNGGSSTAGRYPPEYFICRNAGGLPEVLELSPAGSELFTVCRFSDESFIEWKALAAGSGSPTQLALRLALERLE